MRILLYVMFVCLLGRNAMQLNFTAVSDSRVQVTAPDKRETGVSVSDPMMRNVEELRLSRSQAKPSGTGGVTEVGSAERDFSLPSQDGRTFCLRDYAGRAVFLAFVPAWDDTRTTGELRSLNAKIGDFDLAGAKVLAIGPGGSDNVAKAREIHRILNLSFPLLLDSENTVFGQYGVPTGGFRTTFVVSPAGIVRYRILDGGVEEDFHGQQLLQMSGCCHDDIVESRCSGVGKLVKDFSLPVPGQSDAMSTLLADRRQRATVVLFLSARCPCANAYTDRVRALAAAYSRRGVRFVGVYSNGDETSSEVVKHAKQNGFAFTVLQDTKCLCADHLGAQLTPEAFVLDHRGFLRYRGRIDDSRVPASARRHNLQDAIDAVLSGKPVPGATRAFGCAIVR